VFTYCSEQIILKDILLVVSLCNMFGYHYDGMKSVITQFDSESCIAIEKCPEIFADGIYQSKF
jgi:hypothetical protein